MKLVLVFSSQRTCPDDTGLNFPSFVVGKCDKFEKTAMFRARRVAIALVPAIILVLVLYSTGASWKPPTEWVSGTRNPLKQWTPTASKPSKTLSCQTTADLPDLPINSGSIRYARREMRVRPKHGLERTVITTLNGPLLPEFQDVDLSERSNFTLEHCLEPLILDVPSWLSTPVNTSHLIFGMSTTLERLQSSIPYLQRWLPFTDARLFVVIIGPDEKPPGETGMRELEMKMGDLGMRVSLVKPLNHKDVGSQRYFSITRIIYSNRQPDTKWIVYIDDDTFFPSMHALVGILDGYDANKQHYIGGLSEDW